MASSINGTGKTGCPYVEEWNYTHIYPITQKLYPSGSTTSILNAKQC